ncbi:hypothetical protein JOC77_000987 [Peribacillus deserti]|uniref:Uncharacterized protein n=1 Tax=Peribacillus deserti TaxID=673318 RepID=A0ABS2QEK4_9BACI|nr:hypothetical protein [Peribacillus deserti]
MKTKKNVLERALKRLHKEEAKESTITYGTISKVKI